MVWRRAVCVGAVLAVLASAGARAADVGPVHVPVNLDPVGKPCGVAQTGWTETGEDVFRLPQGLLRSQGMATDGTQWFFSWQGGLERTGDDYVERLALPLDIPPQLVAEGIQHIGDIDIHDGKLFAPLSDASPYHHAVLATYDPTTLQYLSSTEVEPALHSGGISWVAVDPQGVAYTSQWIDAPILNRYDTNDGFKPLPPLTLAVPVTRLQGAKYIDWEGEPSLIGSTDENPKRIVRINLEDGAVTELLRVCAAGEMEGMAIRRTPDGALVHALFVTGNQTNPQNPNFAPQDLAVHLFHYAPPADDAPHPERGTPGHGTGGHGAPQHDGPRSGDGSCVTPLACGADLAQAQYLEDRMNDHFWYGQVLESWYNTAARLPGDLRQVGGWGDSGLWTGVYLGGESFRYATAKHKLAGDELGDTARAYWEQQRDEAKQRVDAMVRKYHLLVNIAKAWHTELAPSVNPTDTHTPASFGGGVIQGEEGMLMRACAPVDAPPAHAMQRNNRVFGPWKWDEDGKQYICETAPSRDTYAGTTFGLLTAFDLVGPDDPDMQSMIRDDVIKLARFLVKYGWNYPRPHGNISLPPLGHDFDNFVSPLFVYVPMARLNMANAARHVADVAGAPADRQQWDAVWQEELASQGPALAASLEVDSAQPNDSYYKFNLHHLTGFNLLRTLTDPTERAIVAQAFAGLDRTTGDDVNAHFEAITYAMTGDPARRAAAVTHLDQWRTYYAHIKDNQPVDDTAGCGKDFTCVPDDQYDVAGPDGSSVTWKPGTSTTKRAALPLAVGIRPETDFLWQRPPTQLSTGYGLDPTYEPPGVDYLTPYWMMRYLTEVATPAVAPFPPTAAPSFR